MSKNQLRRKRRKSKSEIGERNVLAEKRKRGKKELSEPVPSPFKMPEEQLDWDAIADKAKQGIARRGGDMGNGKKLKMKFTIFDRVRTKTTRFGRAYAKGKAEYTYGTIMKIRGKVCEIQWDGEEEGHLMKSHTDFLEGYGGNVKASCAMMALYRMPDPSFNDTLNDIRTILPVLEVGSALAPSANDEIGNVPKDFFEALVREDWRDWVLAVKTEIDSWSMFEAATVVPYESMESGASVIPLGELFSVKRNGKKKVPSICDGKSPERREGFRRNLLINGFGGWTPLVLFAGSDLQERNQRMGCSNWLSSVRTEGSGLFLPSVASWFARPHVRATWTTTPSANGSHKR